MLLGIDQSYTSCAFVVVDDDMNIIDFGTFTSDKGLDIYSRAMYISTSLIDVAKKYDVTRIAIEGLAFSMMGNATRDLAGLLFTIRAMFTVQAGHIPFTEVAPTAVKKKATDSGKASKTEMIEALPPSVRAMFDAKGYKKSRGLPDLADAYFIASVGVAQKTT